MNDQTRIFLKPSYYSGLLFVFFVSVVLYFLEWRNHGINMLDFEVYYRSALRMLHGENLYRIESDGHYIFKYSPVSALFYLPFTLFPLSVANKLYWLFLTGVAISSFYLAFRLCMPGLANVQSGRFLLFILLLTLSLGLHLYREFAIGQVNIVLFLSYLLILRFYQMKKIMPVALLWAAGIFFKPWGLIFLPYFLLKKELRLTMMFGLFAVILFFIPALFYGYNELLGQMGKWFNEMTIEMGNKQSLSADANHTIFSVIYRYTPLRFLEATQTFTLLLQASVLALLAGFVLIFMRKRSEVKQAEVGDIALLMCLMPLLAPANYNTFLMLGLALSLLFVHFKNLPVWMQISFVIAIIFQGGNYNDLWGKELSDFFLHISLVAVGGLLIVINLSYLRFRKIV